MKNFLEKQGRALDSYLNDLVVVVQGVSAEIELSHENSSLPSAVLKVEIDDEDDIDSRLLGQTAKVVSNM